MKYLRLLALGVLVASAWGQSCSEGSGDWAILPPKIGSPNNSKTMPYALHCDTMFVPKGHTTVVYPGVLLYFALPEATHLIRVQGTLELQGSKDNYVSSAGGLDPMQAAPAPSKTTSWAGILVDPEGKLVTRFAGFYGAATPITAFSNAVKIVNTFFTGGTGIIKPDGTLYGLNPQFTAINALDFSASSPEQALAAPDSANPSAAPADTLTAAEKAALFKSQQGGFWSHPLTWVVGGGVLLASGAIGYYALKPAKTPAMNTTPPANNTPATVSMDPLPATVP